MEITFIKSNKNKLQAVVDGNIYNYNNQYNGVKYWICREWTTIKCKARCTTKNGELVKLTGDHVHAQSPTKVEKKVLVNDIKDHARNSLNTVRDIIAINTQNTSNHVKASFPKISSIQNNICKIRKKANMESPTPKTYQDLIIPEKYRKLPNGEDFILHDNNNNIKRIIIFGTKGNLKLLSDSRHWYCDGTFKASPLLFCQIFTIHAQLDDNVFPAIFALLPDKKLETYREFFSEILKLQENLCPSSIMTDYEQGQISSIKSTFPNTENRGCFFHFSQSIFRKIIFIYTLFRFF